MSKDPETVPMKVSELKEGDLVDLYGDKFADPDHDPIKGYEFEFDRVVGAERETAECVRVDFGGESVGFPPDHTV